MPWLRTRISCKSDFSSLLISSTTALAATTPASGCRTLGLGCRPAYRRKTNLHLGRHNFHPWKETASLGSKSEPPSQEIRRENDHPYEGELSQWSVKLCTHQTSRFSTSQGGGSRAPEQEVLPPKVKVLPPKSKSEVLYLRARRFYLPW